MKTGGLCESVRDPVSKSSVQVGHGIIGHAFNPSALEAETGKTSLNSRRARDSGEYLRKKKKKEDPAH